MELVLTRSKFFKLIISMSFSPPNSPVAPFTASYSSNFAELLLQLKCSIAVSTYQAGKVVFISPKDQEKLVQLPRTFNKPMGIALDGELMAVATKNEVVTFKNSSELAKAYPSKKNVYDALFMPRANYYTGYVDIHDLHFGNNKLWAVNTSFSCICTIDHQYSFTPYWKPKFIDKLVSEDRCHLNGMVMKDGAPLYVSALGTGNSKQSWREDIVNGGVIMHVPSGEIVSQGLAMPHSPHMYDDKLYCLLSAKEALICVDPQKGTYEVVKKIPGFVRGMAKHGDFLFICTSKLRQNSSTFKHLKIAENANVASILVLHLPSNTIVASFIWKASVDEIYDIKIIPDIMRPNILNTYDDKHLMGLHLPDYTFWAKS